MQLPYDPEDPPSEPPRGADPLLWRLAHAVYESHQPAADGFCMGRPCRPLVVWPCQRSRLATVGFAASLGSRIPWARLNQR